MTNKYRLLPLLALGFSFLNVSCDQNEQDDYVKGTLPLVTVEASASSVNEGETYSLTFTPSFVSNEDITFKLSIKDGSIAQDFEDFEVTVLDHSTVEWGDLNEESYKVVIPKYSSSYTVNINVLIDEAADENETVTFVLEEAGFLNGKLSQNEFNLSINNVKSDVISLVHKWDQTFDFGGTDYTLCDIGYDMDFILFDDAFGFVDYVGATADCPETAELSMSDLGDGTFHVYANLYGNAGLSGAGISPPFSIPATVDFVRGGSQLVGSYTQEATNAFDSNSPSDAAGNDLRYFYSITIDNAANTVTIFNSETGMQVSSGRMVATPKKVAKIKNANLPARVK